MNSRAYGGPTIGQDGPPVFRSLAGMAQTLLSPDPERNYLRRLADDMTRRVRESYILHLGQIGGLPDSYQQNGYVIKWDGGAYRSGEVWQPIWPQILRAIVELQTTPEMFMAAQFDTAFADLPMTPIYLHNGRARYRFERHNARFGTCVAEQFDQEERELRRRVDALTASPGYPPCESFCHAIDEGLSTRTISPLVAHCVANVESVIVNKSVRDDAAIQLAFQLYDYVHTKWDEIPTQAREAGEKLVQFVLHHLM